MSKILITGATGQLGSLVVHALLKKTAASNIAALVRDLAKAEGLKKAGVELKAGDYEDKGSLVNAFKDVEKLYFVSGVDLERRVEQHFNVIEAAQIAGVKHVLYTSFSHQGDVEPSELPALATLLDAHVKTEEKIKASGLGYSFLRHNLYMDYMPIFVGEQVLETGIYLPAGEGMIACATRKDLAEAASNLLIKEELGNQTYDLSSNQTTSFADMAHLLSKKAGKEVAYISPTPADFKETLTGFGVPREIIAITSDFAQSIAKGRLAGKSEDLRILLGREPMRLEEYINGVY